MYYGYPLELSTEGAVQGNPVRLSAETAGQKVVAWYIQNDGRKKPTTKNVLSFILEGFPQIVDNY